MESRLHFAGRALTPPAMYSLVQNSEPCDPLFFLFHSQVRSYRANVSSQWSELQILLFVFVDYR